MRGQLWIDFETGGVEPWNHSPLSCAIMGVVDDKIIGEWYTQIRQHPFQVTKEALEINKIDINEPGLTFAHFKTEYFSRINDWFFGGTNHSRANGSYLPSVIKPNKDNMPFFCGHNTWFDRQVLQRILGATPYNSVFDGAYYHRIDTMVLANTLQDIGLLKRGENLRLETVCKLLKVKPTGEFHNALTDLRVTREAYVAMKNLIGETKQYEGTTSRPMDTRQASATI